MLLPTICLKDELEQIVLENLTNKNEWYSHLIEHDIFLNMNFSPSSNSNYVYMAINNTDFITNLCCGNIKSKYAWIFWKFLSSNSSAIELLLKNQYKIYYSNFVNNRNPDAMYMIEKNIRILSSCSHLLSSNPSAIHLLQKYPWIVDPNELVKNTNPLMVDIMKKRNLSTLRSDKLRGDATSLNHPSQATKKAELWNDRFLQNPLSVNAILEYLDITPSLLCSQKREDIDHIMNILNTRNINWFYLSSNSHPFIVKILKLCPHRVFSQQIMINSCIDAIDLIRDVINSVSLLQKRRLISFLCKNTNPDILELLKEFEPIFYNWAHLCENPSAMSFLINPQHKTKIKVPYLLKNPNIFQYNYKNMKKNIAVFKEELIQRVWSPANVLKWMDLGYHDFLES
jgi:hypothetical protein